MNTPEQVCITISLPRSTLEGVDSIARSEDRSRSKVIARALNDLLAAQFDRGALVDAAAAGRLVGALGRSRGG